MKFFLTLMAIPAAAFVIDQIAVRSRGSAANRATQNIGLLGRSRTSPLQIPAKIQGVEQATPGTAAGSAGGSSGGSSGGGGGFLGGGGGVRLANGTRVSLK